MKDGIDVKCSEWEYEDHPEAERVTERCRRLVLMLKGRPRIFNGYSTLRAHRYMFHGVTPENCGYFAGNYRGSNFPCLKEYRVIAGNDSRVGTPPKDVKFEMSLFEAHLGFAVKTFAQDLQKAGKFDRKLLLSLAELLAKYLVYYFTIHPYANGNGHTGRLIVLVILKRFQLDPQSWPLDDRPNYSAAIVAHRDGNPTPLRDFILDRILN
ncbi:Fic family protein [Massilia sp. 9I]|uniref:Fic family protein n=1 Tax=Massilia sp. 9I TaxID=2653152 RepID=UPI0012EFDE29|nr:Fic family protein [Massilia sp. 9I]VXC71120.1 putative Fic/DOC family protein [Massilia sp. 9I]